MARRSNIRGVDELKSLFGELERLPQSVATKSARAGARPVFRAVRSNAPEDEGNLKQALMMRRERSRVKGKAVFQITFNPAYNAKLVKVSKDGERSYYPASQEYGFMTVDGQYIPGYRYMRRSVDDTAETAEQRILEVTGQEIDTLLARRGRK